MPAVDADQRIRVLQDENALLREQVADLQRQLTANWVSPIEWRLTKRENGVMSVLVARGLATKDAIMAGLYSDKIGEEPEPKIVDIFICKIRKKLEPFGIQIETRWGQGYYLDDATRTLLKNGGVQKC